ncbi:phospholipase D-like domain-containing protein [Hymenobacter sp. H14-R3]|uniref:phospholipase D-like domain-containing protein n=1 Tax=Hymenobacter sp. H14-R3 TaxID=3046308 RepID=UPI0024BA1677|nr:phospholipase D-like domain-containing protein [Hymenobacter sp. H14-R3]MDJ0365906.1 phospholipase D-like domain-containing protein [Hymenobacter sp. H14-R3]
MQTEAFFTNIRAVILREIGLAKQSIYVAVAWFTDRQLFAALLARQQAGVPVALCLTRDEHNINFQPGGLPFAELEAAGGRVTVVEGRLMHHKFCILDGRDVLTGSYNWTNKAAHHNEENLVLTTGDAELARHFLREFARLTGQPEAATPSPTVQRVLKRLAVIQSLLTLHETEDLPKHIERLEAEPLPDPRLAAVLTALRAHRYAEATGLLQAFVAAHAQVRVWEDTLLAALQLEIARLEAELLALEAERAEAGRLLTAFELWHQRELGELLQEVLALRRDVAHHQRHASAYAESEYQRAHQRYQQQTHDREQAQAVAAHTFALDADGRATLKKLYREAAQLCHPDRVAEAHKNAATAAFQQVLSAYQRQDVAGLQAQLLNLRRGIFTAASPALSSVTTLQARRDMLAAKHSELIRELAELRAAEAFGLAQASDTEQAEYLATNRAVLLTDRDRLQAQLAQLLRQETV